MRFETLEEKVIQWADRRGILEHGKPHSQLLKAVSEMGELCDAEGKNDIDAIRDAVGDVMVCLINYCALRKIDINDCLWEAYKQIQCRTGRLMPDGTFVKDEGAEMAAAPDMLEAPRLVENEDMIVLADPEIIKAVISKAMGE